VNTELLTFNLDDVKKDVEENNSNKKNKALWEAYQIAAEGHDLAHFKNVLASHEAAMAKDIEEREQKEQEKKEKKEKAEKRKSTAATGSEDVDMEDAEGTAPSAKKAKGSKKRKKDDESDGENDKVRSGTIVCPAITNQLTACKDSKDQAQVDNQDAQGRICCEAQEGDQVKEEGERRGRGRSA
jgi:hypothetical protein